MNKVLKIVLIFLAIDALIVLGYLGYKSFLAGGKDSTVEDYPWVTIDESFQPKDYVEEYIKRDSELKGFFPVYIRNYGKDKSILRNFRGKNFARPTDAQLNMMYKGLEDWVLIDLRYKDNEREVTRTILYVCINGIWKVGDTGNLMKQ